MFIRRRLLGPIDRPVAVQFAFPHDTPHGRARKPASPRNGRFNKNRTNGPVFSLHWWSSERHGASRRSDQWAVLATTFFTISGEDHSVAAVATSNLENFSADLQSCVENELESGEKIVWLGQPIAGRFARQAWPIVLFGIPWTAFSIFWMGAAGGFAILGNGGKFLPGGLFCLFGLPFVLIGFGMLSSPYWMRRSARKSVYAVTDRRAIIFSSGLRGKISIRSFAPEGLTDLEREQYPDGSGDLIFTRDIRRTSDSTTTKKIGFMAVPDVKSVEALIRQMVDERSRSGHAADAKEAAP